MLAKGLFILLTVDSNEVHKIRSSVFMLRKKSAFLNNKKSKKNVAILGNKAKFLFLLFRKGNCNLVNVKIKNSSESEGSK